MAFLAPWRRRQRGAVGRLERYLLTVEILEDRLVCAVDINVNAVANVHAINPDIYGLAFASTSSLNDLNATINRSGGNAETTYNWLQNATNRAADYFFESIADGPKVPGLKNDTFIADTKAAGAQPDLTIPLIGRAAKVAANRGTLASFNVAKYGAQQATDPYNSNFGNGVRPNGTFITGNDPNDAYVAADVNFQKAWVQHLVNKWGTAANGGLRFYSLDNEASIWQEAHRDIKPVGATMEEMYNLYIAYASMIKSVDPSAQILGPEEWGWDGFRYSGYDQQYGAAHGYSSYPDRAAHGNMDYIPWLLQQIRNHDAGTGQRLLDYLTVHYYPQGGEFSNDVSQAMQLLRNRSTRSLWDPNYVDQSWINDKVNLIPRLHNWVNTNYPGTKVGLTEYNWGAENHMNGATAQADLLGIFGRENLDMAIRWTTPPVNSPVYNAFKMYRNYDGNDSTFGDQSVAVTVPNPDQVSAFASIRSSDGALTIMVINKNLYQAGATTSIAINLANFQGSGVAQEWLLAGVNGNQTVSAITHLPDIHFSGNTFTVSAPMQSVQIFVLPPGASTPAAATTTALTAAPSSGQAGQPVTFTATVSSGTAGAITGSVTFRDGAATLATVTLNGGQATWTTSALSVGSHAITAIYSGNASFAGSTSSTVNVNVTGVTGRSIIDGPGIYDPNSATWYLRNTTTAGAPNITPFAYGFGGAIPITGDWNGDGKTSIGLYDPRTATWYLRNNNGSGSPDITPFSYGFTGAIPVVGDWDGNGTTTIGLYNPANATWYLRNSNSPGAPSITTFAYGFAGAIPVVGDWDGNGTTTIGLHNPANATWYLRNSNSPGAPSINPFAYGFGSNPVVGDWDGNGTTTIGIYNPANATWYLRNSNSAGAPNISPFAYGFGANPIVGAWNYPALPLQAMIEGPGAAALTQADLDAVVAGALARLQAAGVDLATLQRLGTAQFSVANLPGVYLGLADVDAHRVAIDTDGAGHGWFVDPTPLDDSEFEAGVASNGPAAGHSDLVTVVLHELGHLAGLADLDSSGAVMSARLAASTRHLGRT